jgi:hypothetical protein
MRLLSALLLTCVWRSDPGLQMELGVEDKTGPNPPPPPPSPLPWPWDRLPLDSLIRVRLGVEQFGRVAMRSGVCFFPLEARHADTARHFDVLS